MKIVPSNMQSNPFSFELYNATINGKIWQPKTTPKAIIILVHGMGEHIGRYEKSVIPHLVKNDFAVVAYDQFGHGKTSGKRGHNPSYDAVLCCITKVIVQSNATFKSAPLFLYGHSMGGNVVLNYVLRRKHPFKGVIATSPFLKLAFEPPKWKLFLGEILGKIAPSITMPNELNPNDISRIQAEVDAYVSDPLVHNKISPNYSVKFIETGKWAIENAHQLKVPTLLLHGTGDKIIDHKATAAFSKNSNGVAEIKLFDGGYHELHNDLCRNEMLNDISNWLNIQLEK